MTTQVTTSGSFSVAIEESRAELDSGVRAGCRIRASIMLVFKALNEQLSFITTNGTFLFIIDRRLACMRMAISGRK